MDLGVDRIVPAVIGIDLHRGHLDPAVATMPLEARRATILVEANRIFFSAARQVGVPMFICNSYRDVPKSSNPFWRTRPTIQWPQKNVERHNLEGSGHGSCRLRDQDYIVNAKRDMIAL